MTNPTRSSVERDGTGLGASSPRGRVTMRNVAEALGVTPATVSMALANHSRISSATRQRVQRVAREMGYVPNPFVSALMRTRRSGREELSGPVIALVNLQTRRDGWAMHPSPTVRQMRRGALERARSRGYRAEEFWLRESGMTPARLSDILYARNIRGVVLSPPGGIATLPAMNWDELSPVALTAPRPELRLRTVCNDHYGAMMHILAECHCRGYRRPGLVVDHGEASPPHHRWEAGFALAREMFPDLDPVPILRADAFHGEPLRLQTWVRQYQPDVVVAATEESTVLELQAMRHERAGPVGLVWTACPGLGHAVSGVYPNGYLVGSAAVDAVVEMVEQNECGLEAHARALMLQCVWNEGGTLPALEQDRVLRRVGQPTAQLAC